MRINKEKERLLPYEEAIKRFYYCEIDGCLKYNRDTGNGSIKKGQKVGSLRKSGYLELNVEKRMYRVHRVVWLVCKGKWPEDQIDHVDRDKANNRIENLRDVDAYTNHANKKNNNAIEDIGVYYTGSSWRAGIGHKGRTVFSKSVSTKEEARELRKDLLDLYK